MTPEGPTAIYWCEYAWLPPGRVEPGTTLELTADRITRVEPRTVRPRAAKALAGLTFPGFANVHSHAFHRALRGRTQEPDPTGAGSFWTWREQMYALAGTLEPDSYHALARSTYAELLRAGFTTVGEFHYLHHDPAGRPYADPNAMAHAVIAAAREVGLRITLLDTCYLADGIARPATGIARPATGIDPGGVARPATGVRRRFADGAPDRAGAERWADRAGALAQAYAGDDDVRIGAAVHSVRAVPADALEPIAAWAAEHAAPLHVHLSEQPRENADCLEAYALTPTKLLADKGILGPGTTAVHATHLTPEDIALLGASGTTIGMCPTTERDLADGIGPARALHDAGCRVAIGTDSHAMIDPFEETRLLELHERLNTGRRGHWTTPELIRAATENGHACLGVPDAGTIARGSRADLVTVRLTGPRLEDPHPAGSAPDPATAIVFAATACDVTHVIARGRPVPLEPEMQG